MGCRFFSWTAYFGQNGVVVTVEDQRTAKLSVPSQPQGFRELFFPAKPGTGAVPGRIVDQCLQWHLPRELRRRGSGEHSIGKSHARKRIRSGTASPEFRGGVTCRGRGLACLRTRVPACACELAGWLAGLLACRSTRRMSHAAHHIHCLLVFAVHLCRFGILSFKTSHDFS